MISPKPISPPAYSTVPPSSTTNTVTSPPASSYPAVLVGRPTGPSETKPKIPPPVPPRGTPKEGRPSQTNGKGAMMPTNGSLLHDLLCLSLKSDNSLYSSTEDCFCQSESCRYNIDYRSNSLNDFTNESLEKYDNHDDLLNIGLDNKSKKITTRTFSLKENDETKPKTFKFYKHHSVDEIKEICEKKISNLHEQFINFTQRNNSSPDLKNDINVENNEYHPVTFDDNGTMVIYDEDNNKNEETKGVKKKIKKNVRNNEAGDEISKNNNKKFNQTKHEPDKPKYGLHVKALKKKFDKSESSNTKKTQDFLRFYQPRTANFIGMSSYTDTTQYRDIPRIIISPTSTNSNDSPSYTLSPKKRYGMEVYNSKKNHPIQFDSYDYEGDLV